ncbi:MAG: hypothetical protein EOO05_13335 [Chitinophagaceae bacterium]|nr:MAG: hypothetical protein EOO05_13335 [Chitinophagaceae bacterium]
MKKILFFLLVATALNTNAQSLKDALYGGKLKLDTGTVIRKGDDLSTKIDTSTKKPVVAEAARPAPARLVVADDGTVKVDSVVATAPVTAKTMSDGTVVETTEGETAAATEPLAAKDNNAIWKEYIDSLTSTLKSEVLPNKKIKSGDYSILIDYVIGLDGTITVNNVSSFPESTYLDQQVRERLTLTAPQLTPLLNSYGKPRKAPKKQTITLSK